MQYYKKPNQTPKSDIQSVQFTHISNTIKAPLVGKIIFFYLAYKNIFTFCLYSIFLVRIEIKF